MRHDNLYTSKETTEKLMNGIRKVADAVGSTMGTGGSNAVIEAIESPGHLMTNDGWTIANSILLSDPIEDMGRKILLEAINRANKSSGDGSSTTCVVTRATLEEGMKHMADNHKMVIKRSLEECIPLIEESIKKQTRQITSPSQIEQVATISSEDPEIGKRIAEIYQQIGNSGIIHWDISKTAEDSYQIGTGITVEGATYYSPYMCDAAETGQNTNYIRLANPHILVVKQKITSVSDFSRIGAELNGKEVKDLIVFAEDADPLIVPDLLKTRLMRGFRIVIVKMPVIWRDQWYEDLCKATGAKFIDSSAGVYLKDATMEHVGRVGNILITKDDTFLDGIQNVDQHLAALELEGTDNARQRMARLNTKTARYFVGAHSDSALSYRRLKVEDAISAAYHALNGGIVAGGGVALFNAARELPQDSIGAKILRESLMYPSLQIMRNSGVPEHEARNNLATCSIGSESAFEGFDTSTGKIVDMFEAGIVDPAPVVLNAVKNAISVAATILTINTLVTMPRDDEPQQPQVPVLSR